MLGGVSKERKGRGREERKRLLAEPELDSRRLTFCYERGYPGTVVEGANSPREVLLAADVGGITRAERGHQQARAPSAPMACRGSTRSEKSQMQISKRWADQWRARVVPPGSTWQAVSPG